MVRRCRAWSFAVLCLVASALSSTISSAGLTIGGYDLVSVKPAGRGQFDYTYRARMTNTGPTADGVSATLLMAPPGTVVIDGSVTFERVPGGATVASKDVFVLRQSRKGDIDTSWLQWAVQATPVNSPPLADAGHDQSILPGAQVQLDGSGSSDPDGNQLTYAWTLVSKPEGSSVVLAGAATATPTFVADSPGDYQAELVVSDGSALSAPAMVTIRTQNRRPTANAGADQTVAVLTTVHLDGTESSDLDGDPLTFNWSLRSRPERSQATLSSASEVTPTFVADVPGKYVVGLVLNDGSEDSRDDTVTIDTRNSPPVADAGPNQTVAVGATSYLTAADSSDVDGDRLSYSWRFSSVPVGSLAELSAASDPSTSFLADRPGRYVLRLIVSDGSYQSTPSLVTIDTTASAPVANAGPNQSTAVGATVNLDGSGSTDVNGGALSYGWSLTSIPQGSLAALSTRNSVTTSFVPDLPGVYVAQLVVRDETAFSLPSTIAITTTNSAPVANAGPSQTAAVGETVWLDGTGSSDADGDPLTFRWALVSRPPRSAASLQSPTEGLPVLVVDEPGTYVIQLIVNDGTFDSAPREMTVSTLGSPPVADARLDATGSIGATAQLDGSASFDPDLDPLTYSWSLLTKPTGSIATLSNATIVNPTFVIDRPGTYVAQLIVNDGTQDSAPDTLEVNHSVTGLAANAGPDQVVDIGATVQLDGTGSLYAPNYAWAFTSKPAGSTAVLSGSTSATPTFLVDRPGDYVVQLVVSDGTISSAPDSVTVRTSPAGVTLSPLSLTLSPGGGGTLTVSIPPSGGMNPAITLASSNPSVATVPAEVLIPAGQTSTTIPVTAGANGGAIITGSTGGLAPGRAVVAVGSRLVEWIKDASGVWEDPTNWSGGLVPGNGDIVLIDRPAGVFVVTVQSTTALIQSLYATEQIVVNGTLVVAGDGVIARGLSLTGTLTGSGKVTLAAPMTWETGTVSLAGGLEVGVGQTLTVATANQHVLSGPLTNHGTVQWDAGIIYLQGGSAVVNASDGVWDVRDNLTLTSTNCGAPTFTNAGLVRKTAGTAAFRVESCVTMSNTGTLEVQSGTLVMAAAGLSTSGLLKAGAGTTVFLDRVTLQSGTTFSGTGLLHMNGTTTVTANLSVPLPVLLSSTLTGSGKVTLAAPMTWDTGTVSLTGGLEVGVGRTLTVATANQHVLSGPLTNHGTVQWDAGIIYLQGNSAVVNASDGVWDVRDNLTLTSTNCGAPTFTNAGLVRKTAGTAAFRVESCVTMSNTGTLEVQSGTLVMAAAGLSTSGLLKAGAGTTVFLDRVTLQSGTTFSGTGLLHMNGTTTVTANLSVPLPVLLSSTLTGSGKVTLAAPMTWETGTVSLAGGLEVGVGQTLTVATANQHVLSGPLTNHGTVQWDAGIIYLQGGSAVVNASDGVWDVRDNLTLTSTNCGAPTFTNAGLVRKTAGTAAFRVESCVTMSNTGTLEVQSGTLVMAAAGLSTSGLLKAGAGTTVFLDRVTLQSGTTFSGTGLLHMNGTTTVTANLSVPLPVLLSSTLTGSGKVTLAAPMTWETGTVSLTGGLEVGVGRTLTVATANQHVLSGPLTNHGTVQWDAGIIYLQGNSAVVNASDGVWDVRDNLTLTSTNCGAPTFANAGLLRKTAATGTFAVSSCVALTNTGTIQLRIGGTGAGQFDSISAGQVTLGGTLDVVLTDGFTPSSGNLFSVFGYSSRTGTFAVINGHGQTYTVSYGPNALTLLKP